MLFVLLFWQLEAGNWQLKPPFSPSKTKQMCIQMCTFYTNICAIIKCDLRSIRWRGLRTTQVSQG